jgi:hypothetical protein
MGHRQPDPHLARLYLLLIVLAQPAVLPKPSERALYHPVSRLHHELARRLWCTNNLDIPAQLRLYYLDKMAAVGRIHPALLDRRRPALRLPGYVDTPHRRPGRKLRAPRSRQGALRCRPLCAACADLPSCRRRSREAPLSVVFTDWLSMATALGVSLRPVSRRSRARSSSAMRSKSPKSRHL